MSKRRAEGRTGNTGDAMLRIAGAVKRYGARTALDGLELELRPGTWTGLLGPNGAGKTTALLAIAGLLPLDGGCITIDGQRVQGPSPRRVGWVPQDIALYPTLTASENLRALGALHGVPRRELDARVDWALDWIGLAHRAHEPVEQFSGGMRRRVNIAGAVLHRPPLLLLDEPTVGVDPQARARIFRMLEALCAEGMTLLHSSHELDDLESACDTLAVLDRGRVVAHGSTVDLIRRHGMGPHGMGPRGGGSAVLTLEGRLPESVEGFEPQGPGRWTASIDDPLEDVPRVLEAVRRVGGYVDDLSLRRPGLRDVFLTLTGKELRE